VTKSQLIEAVAAKLSNVSKKDIEIIVETIFNSMTEALTRDERIEIRGFGSFVSKIREAREGRNPKTGEKVSVPKKRTPFFTVGKELKERVNTASIAAPAVTD
jgi:integration host factor subunit beta